jgi:hypothetical protein
MRPIGLDLPCPDLRDSTQNRELALALARDILACRRHGTPTKDALLARMGDWEPATQLLVLELLAAALLFTVKDQADKSDARKDPW